MIGLIRAHYGRDWRTMEETLLVYLKGTGKTITVLLSESVGPSHPTSIDQFLQQFLAVHRETFYWLLEHAQPTPQHEIPPSITLAQLSATTQYLKGDQNV